MSKAKPQVFLDSNVIFSGLYSSAGAPGFTLEHFVRGNLAIVVSQQVLEELIRTIKEKLPDALPALRRLLVNTPPEVVADPKLPDIKRWKKHLQTGDAAILAAAISAQPDYFISSDKHFLDNREIVESDGLKIITPAQSLKTSGKGDKGDERR
ncbi:MAG: PIN domain-containing protein [Dehalococcoidales bacterium]|nr:PIN domain-containing protein [Dehalococcoidales bacterium]